MRPAPIANTHARHALLCPDLAVCVVCRPHRGKFYFDSAKCEFPNKPLWNQMVEVSRLAKA